MKRLSLAAFLALSTLACVKTADVTSPTPAPDAAAPAASGFSVVDDIEARLRQLPETPIDYDRALLTDNDRAVVAKLIEASRAIDEIFWLQVWEQNPAWRERLTAAASASPKNRAALEYFLVMKGPWDRLAKDQPFIGGVGEKPAGSGFYPADITKEEVERWIAANPGDREAFQGLFTVIRRQNGRLVAIPYSEAYRPQLERAAKSLREAAALTDNPSLRDYLGKRADAFFTNDYYASDFAWMDLDSAIEVVIGPYEVYEDSLFNYKAAFESFVTVTDRAESEKLKLYAGRLADMERALPMPDQYKNPDRGSDSPIRVVQEIFTAGDARSGVQTAAFNLPNDERVREAKGSKKVLLKNVMEAKFRQSGLPIARRVLDEAQQSMVAFAPYFNHTLFHELAHGIGPGIITGPDGQKVENRILLKNLYSTIEECKADVLGVWTIEWAMDQGLMKEFSREALHATNTALMFRSMRFGLEEAHGRGTAIQWNWYRERGAIEDLGNGRFRSNTAKMPEAVKSLAEELLMIEATGDFARAERLVEKYGRSNAEIDRVVASLKDIPVDIDPVFVSAGETATR